MEAHVGNKPWARSPNIWVVGGNDWRCSRLTRVGGQPAERVRVWVSWAPMVPGPDHENGGALVEKGTLVPVGKGLRYLRDQSGLILRDKSPPPLVPGPEPGPTGYLSQKILKIPEGSHTRARCKSQVT